MFRPLELWVGLRYTRAKRRNHFISVISLISMLGIALGITALVTVLSVMNGFEQELRARILGVVAHVTVTQPGGLRHWQEVDRLAAGGPHVTGVAPYIDGEAMLNVGQSVRGTMVRGVLPGEEPRVSEIAAKMIAGRLADLKPGEFGIVLGRELALSLGAQPGDKVTLITPQATVTPAGVLPRLKRFTVVGIFQIGMYEYDSALALIHLEDAARLFQLEPGTVTGVRLRLNDMDYAPRARRALSHELSPAHIVTDWTQEHVNFFRAVQTEKRVMFIILLLIVTVAAFNIISTLVMTVTDKQTDIAILRTMGATPRSIMLVFMVQGAIIGIVGTLLGGIGGVMLALNVETIVPAIERVFHVQFLPGDVYYISELPSQLHWGDVLLICTVAMVLSLLATLYPAWRAARTQPAEALRYE